MTSAIVLPLTWESVPWSDVLVVSGSVRLSHNAWHWIPERIACRLYRSCTQITPATTQVAESLLSL